MKLSLFLKALTGFHFSPEDFCTAMYLLAKKKNRILKRRCRHFSQSHGIEIDSFSNIQRGLIIIHPYSITINCRAKIGENCAIFKGATIGSQRSGKREGAPTIGNNCVIGINSTVVGGIVIGDDVFIAPNSFVNFDVPPHSLVVGNPGVVHSKENGRIVQDYIDINHSRFSKTEK